MTAGADGVANFELEDDLVMIYGEYSVVGRSFLVHADVDDLGDGGHQLSQGTGKIFCQDQEEFLRDLEHQVEKELLKTFPQFYDPACLCNRHSQSSNLHVCRDEYHGISRTESTARHLSSCLTERWSSPGRWG